MCVKGEWCVLKGGTGEAIKTSPGAHSISPAYRRYTANAVLGNSRKQTLWWVSIPC